MNLNRPFLLLGLLLAAGLAVFGAEIRRALLLKGRKYNRYSSVFPE